MAGDWIYYSDSADGSALYNIRIDGTGRTKLCGSESDLISVVGEWVYFMDNDDEKTYRVSTDGGNAELVE